MPAQSMAANESKPIEILLVEDNSGDARLAREALRDAKVRNNLTWISDGAEALAFLRREGKYERAARPDLILLDLNLPRKDGREVLTEIKADDRFRRIPVVVLTTSQAEEDILRGLRGGENDDRDAAEAVIGLDLGEHLATDRKSVV